MSRKVQRRSFSGIHVIVVVGYVVHRNIHHAARKPKMIIGKTRKHCMPERCDFSNHCQIHSLSCDEIQENIESLLS